MKKSIVQITFAALAPVDKGKIEVNTNGLFPLYRIAEVLLGPRLFQSPCQIVKRLIPIGQTPLPEDSEELGEAV